MTLLEQITEIEELNQCYRECAKASREKYQTQHYGENLLINNIILSEELRNNTYRVLPTNDFILHERGKIRDIHAPNIRDRIVQKTLNKNVLVPTLRKYLIYDNGASLKGKGTSFTRKRLKIHWNYAIKNYGDFYILKIDIKKYFENIDHEILWNLVKDKIDDSIKSLTKYVIDSSTSTNKGLNLGSETPQILAVFYLSIIDNYCKTVKRIKCYGRYMDDIYVFSDSKLELKELKNEISLLLCNKLKLQANNRKTYITKSTRGIVFMQQKYFTKEGKLVVTPVHKKFTRERRKLKAYSRCLKRDEILVSDIALWYKSWKCAILKSGCCRKSVFTIDKYFHKLFDNIIQIGINCYILKEDVTAPSKLLDTSK